MPTPTLVEGAPLIAGNATRQRPWMTLGKQLDRNLSLEEALAISGSDDYVYPVALYDLENPEHQEEVEGITGVKSDKYGIMGVHGNGYTITQRREILELAFEIEGLSKGDGHVDTIANLGDKAQKFMALVLFDDLVIDPNGIADTIERGLYVATSFDGSLPNLIGYHNMRITCFNQLQMILKGLSQMIKVRHTRNAEERMNQAARALNYLGAVEKELIAKAEQMLKVDGDKALTKLLDQFWSLDVEGDAAKTRRQRERGDVRMLYEGTGNTNVDVVGRNGWAAYNAVVEYLDHAQGVKGVKGNAIAVRRAERAVLPGQTADKKLQASKLVLSMN